MNPEWFKFNNSFCPLAFLHLHVDTKKSKSLCCLSEDTIDPSMSFNSAEYKQIRQDMLDGKTIPSCEACQSDERKHLVSSRQRYLKDIKDRKQVDLLMSQISKHASGQDIDPYWYDLRISNNCNLACQICGPVSSSTIAAKQGKDNPHLKFEIDVGINPHSQRVYLAGGEPFLIKKFVAFLEKIENTDCEIIVNTNATIVTKGLIEQLNRFSDVCMTVSLDGVGQLNDRLRSGSNWQDIDKNIDKFVELGYSLHAQTAVQADNINELVPLSEYITSKNFDHWTLIEVMEPENFSWKKNQNISKSELEKLLTMPIINRNMKSVLFLRHVISNV